jgi:NAD(P)H-hydrate epimerase
MAMAMIFPYHSGEIPYLTTQQMVEVDRSMVEDYHIELIQMMENAGRNLARLARARFLEGNSQGKKVAVLAGTGGNGGGALVGARHLSNWGASVAVFVTRPKELFTGVPAHQIDILKRIPQIQLGEPGLLGLQAGSFDLVIDGIIGYSLKGTPHGEAAVLIHWANSQPAPVLSLDVPSGVDAGDGRASNPSIRAVATMTLALPKKGMETPGVKAYLGELYLADIGVPPALYASLGLDSELKAVFAQSDIIRLL